MIPAEAVEAAAKIIVLTVVDRSWESLLPSRQEWYREQARAVLEAAAPYMLAEAWEEGRRADDFEVSIGLDRNPYMLNNEGEK